MSLETHNTHQKEQKAAEKYRQHQITVLQQQITNLEERRDELKNVVGQLSSHLVSSCVVRFCIVAVVFCDMVYCLLPLP